MIKIVSKYIFIFSILLFLSSCSGKLFTTDKLDNLYKEVVSDMEIGLYYNPLPNYMPVAVKNVGSTFMTNLNLSIECKNEKKNQTHFVSLGNLKPYFFKEIVVPFYYDKCNEIVVSYIFYPDNGGDFTYASKHSGFYIPEEPSVPVEGKMRIK